MNQDKNKGNRSSGLVSVLTVLLCAGFFLASPAGVQAVSIDLPPEESQEMHDQPDLEDESQPDSQEETFFSAGRWETLQSSRRWLKPDGTYARNEIVEIEGSEYLFGPSEELASGWVQLSDQWYAADRQTGRLLKNTWFENCWLNDQGVWISQNWQKSAGGWTLTLGDGTRAVGGIFTAEDGKNYCFDSLGYMKTGWIERDGGWMYARWDGSLLADTFWKGHYFDQKGFWHPEAWIQNGQNWQLRRGNGQMAADGLYESENGQTYYFDRQGSMKTGWVQLDGNWHYFVSSGEMAISRWISGKYYLNDQGIWIPSSWVKDEQTGRYRYVYGDGSWPADQSVLIDGQTYRFGADGWMQTGLIEENGSAVYLNPDGSMLKNAEAEGWYFNSKGIGFTGYDKEIARFCDEVYAQTDGTLYGAFMWTADKIEYQQLAIPYPMVYGETQLQNYARKAMSGQGNCYCYAALFTYLARGLGYQPEYVSGQVNYYTGGMGPHGWVVMYENGTKYYYDPEAEHEFKHAYNFYRVPAGSTVVRYDR